MGVVHLFGSRKRDDEDAEVKNAANSNNEPAQVLELVFNKKIAKGVAPTIVYQQMEALLIQHGVNFSLKEVRSDYKILTYLVQGMVDRANGSLSSDRCLMLDTLRHALAYEEPVDNHESQELFGDLLGRLD